MDGQVNVTSLQFRNFKGLRDFSVSLDRMNVLVGPNNAGKSTVIGAFRVLAAALPKPRSYRPELLDTAGGPRQGYSIPIDSLPISTANVHTNYDSLESTIDFRLSNGYRLHVIFPADGGCQLFADSSNGVAATSPADFKSNFPISLVVVPVLGPLEQDEEVVLEETVRRNLGTHRASRHFRNFWRYYPDQFENFRTLLKQTWPGMDISPPELPSTLELTLSMFYSEDRMDREISWAGFGFQSWCQVLSYVVRTPGSSLFVIDEPEIYLHPDLQRQLVRLLRDCTTDIVLATHSSDIIAEADPGELLIIDRSRKSARRVEGPRGVTRALEAVGSVRNTMLTQVTRTRRMLFLEGDDFRILSAFAKKLRLDRLSLELDFAIFSWGGFPETKSLNQFAKGIEEAVGGRVLFAAMFDRDFRSDAEVSAYRASVAEFIDPLFIPDVKEIENFLLHPPSLDRALAAAVKERARRKGLQHDEVEPSLTILRRLTEDERTQCSSQYVGQATRYAQVSHSPLDASTITKQVLDRFESEWMDDRYRWRIVPGKDTLSSLNEHCQSEYGVTLTPSRIIAAMTEDEVPRDLARFLRDMDAFRERTPG